MEICDRVLSSSRWAAYGDALGFITELADSRIVKRRCGAERVERLMPWTRRIGGQFGVDVDLPQGCYSDDTQLRLSTCRAITGDGHFDVEAFAKVELPIWRAYALGAGRGSKAAAKSLTKLDVQWCSNFFGSRPPSYMEGGGNGAAMRIQPHVWSASPGQRDSEVVRNIIRNAITTHGHPRGIVGAAFHGLALLHSVRSGVVPGPNEWNESIEKLQYIPQIIRKDEELGTFWLDEWERLAGQKAENSFGRTVNELRDDVLILTQMINDKNKELLYYDAVKKIGGLDASTRGSGTKTSLLASFLATVFEGEVLDAMKASANLLGSDTDSIATMAGAILGATCPDRPPEDVEDGEYILEQASRMCSIRAGELTSTFEYPDLLYWRAPNAELDVAGRTGKDWTVAGLGLAQPTGKRYEKGGKSRASWQWFKLAIGQSVLLKVREEPISHEVNPFRENEDDEQVASHGGRTLNKSKVKSRTNELSVLNAFKSVLDSGFDPRVVGAMLLKLSDSESSSDAARFAEMVHEERRTYGARQE